MNIFFNEKEQRARAGWRLAGLFFLMELLSAIFIMIIRGLHAGNSVFWSVFASAIAAFLSIFLAARGLDNREWADYGLNIDSQFLQECGSGLLIAGVVMGIIFWIEYETGFLSLQGFGWQHIHTLPYLFLFVRYFLWMILVGCYEELLFRGYVIVNLAEGCNFGFLSRQQASALALVLSALIFGLMHLSNPHSGWPAAGNIFLAGLALGIPFLITGRLGISVGLHIGWNFFQGGIFGFAVSGLPNRMSLLQISQQGPNYITGGAFGPEAGLGGLIGFVLLLAGALLYLKWTHHPLKLSSRFGIYHVPQSSAAYK